MNLRVNPAISVAATFSAVFAIGFFVAIAPQLKPIGESLTRLDIYGKQTIAATQKSPESLQDAKAKSDIVLALFPAENNLYDLSVQIDAWSKVSGVQLTGLSLNPVVATGKPTTSAQANQTAIKLPAGVQTASVAVGAKGTYEAVQNFIEGLTRLNRYIQIQNVAFSKSATPDGSDVTIQVAATTYFKPYETK